MFVQTDQKWVRLGNSLLTTLLATLEGRRFLIQDDPFIPEIVKGFSQLDPVSTSHRSYYISVAHLRALSITLRHKPTRSSLVNVFRRR